MSNDEQDAAIGRMVVKYADAKKRRAALLSEACALGENLVTAGNVLRTVAAYRDYHDGRQDGVMRSKDSATIVKRVTAEVRDVRALLKDAGVDVN